MKHLLLMLYNLTVRAVMLVACVLLVSGCNSYSLKDALKNDDMITGLSGDVNIARLDAFINDVTANKQTQIRITSFTIEGDAVISDLTYETGTIKYTYDNSRDKHGRKNKGKYQTQCAAIEAGESTAAEEQTGIRYFLTGCSEMIGVHDPAKQEIYLLNLPQR